MTYLAGVGRRAECARARASARGRRAARSMPLEGGGGRVLRAPRAPLAVPGPPASAVEVVPEGEPLGGVLRRAGTADRAARAPGRTRCPLPEEPRLPVALDGRCSDEGDALVVDALGPVRAEHRPLDADSRVPIDVTLHVIGDLGRDLAAARVTLWASRGDGGHGRERLPQEEGRCTGAGGLGGGIGARGAAGSASRVVPRGPSPSLPGPPFMPSRTASRCHPRTSTLPWNGDSEASEGVAHPVRGGVPPFQAPVQGLADAFLPCKHPHLPSQWHFCHRGRL